MPKADAIRLRHMREAVVAALEMSAGRERDDLSADMILAMALTR